MIDRRFDYVKFDEKRTVQCNKFKERVETLAHEIDSAIKCPRSKALALTKLEECFMWVGKGLRNDQICERPETQHVPERTDE